MKFEVLRSVGCRVIQNIVLWAWSQGVARPIIGQHYTQIVCAGVVKVGAKFQGHTVTGLPWRASNVN